MPRIDSGIEDAFSRFDAIKETAEIETLMKIMGEIRTWGAHLGRIIDKKEMLTSDDLTDEALKQQQHELKKPYSVFLNVVAGLADAASNVAGTDLLKFSAKVASAGIGGCGGYMGQVQQSDLAPIQAKVQTLQNRAMMGRQDQQGKQGELSQALQGIQSTEQGRHDAVSAMLR